MEPNPITPTIINTKKPFPLSKRELLIKLKNQVKTCTYNMNQYVKQKDYKSAADMKSRIIGIEMALDLAKLLKK